MAGANPQRTSWVPDEAPDAASFAATGTALLTPEWYRPIEAFIPGRVQVIAAKNLLYLSTARGLYAFHLDGSVAWTYGTAMPLGHSPTIAGDVAYVGCFDGRIHAVNANNGKPLGLSPPAQAGFQTNPLVVGGVVYMGSRDGYFYAWRLGQNEWVWRFPEPGKPPLSGPILFSAAWHEKDQVIYFAANDGYAYALRPDGRLLWKSRKLPGEGFRSWWPVVHQDAVILAGSSSRRSGIAPQAAEPDLQGAQANYFFTKGLPKGTIRSPRSPEGWLDTSRSVTTAKGTIPSNSDYTEDFPADRTYLVLKRADGQEYQYDFDGDGKPEYAPILWWGTRGGNRYPPVVGADGNLYQTNLYFSDDWIPGGHVSGWQLHTPFISTPASRWVPSDEPLAYSAGGRFIYWNHCCDRTAGAIDISVPNASFPKEDPSREWWYFSYNLDSLIPGYSAMMDGLNLSRFSGLPDCPGPYGGRNGIYQSHTGDQNPPIPYQGKLYFHRGNSLIALSPDSKGAKKLPLVPSPATAPVWPAGPTADDVRNRLIDEVERILAAGHLRPGWGRHGLIDNALERACGDKLSDYWHHPADTHIALIGTLPHLPPELQSRVIDYLKKEMAAFPVHRYTTVGWGQGSARESFATLPPEASATKPSEWDSNLFTGWRPVQEGGPRVPPYFFYALWKFAKVTGGASALFAGSRDRLPVVPAAETLIRFPFVHNAYIAGYLGYLELEKLAGQEETPAVRKELDRLMRLRAETFTTDTPYEGSAIASVEANCRALTISRNFIFLVPELAAYLKTNAAGKVREALKEYERVAPYWFVSFPETGFGEGTLSPLYDRLLFLAKAYVLGASQEELIRYLDIPGFPTGDLFYLQFLTAALEARPAAPHVTVGVPEKAGQKAPALQ